MNTQIKLFKRLSLSTLFICFFIIPSSTHAFSYSSDPCGATKDDCPAGPVAGLTLTNATDDKHLYRDEGSKNVECTYGADAKKIVIKYSCVTDAATAKLESEYSNGTKERPVETNADSRMILSKRRGGACDIPTPPGVDAQRCNGHSYADKYFVYVIASYPWIKTGVTKEERDAAIAASEAGAMNYVEAGIAAAKSFSPKETPKNGIKGKAYSLDVLGLEEPIPYAQVSLKLGSKTYRTTADKNGEYTFEIEEGNTEKKGLLTLTLMGEKDGTEYFEVVDDSVNKDPVEISSEVEIDKGIDLVIGLTLGNGHQSTSDFRNVRGLTSRYYELYQAIDHAERVLKLDITKLRGDVMLPITVFAYSEDVERVGSSHYSSDYGTIHLSKKDSKYVSDGPFTIFHEFGHHIMHTFYQPTLWNSSLDDTDYTTHAGIFNSNTADSLGEGYATFFALIMAQEHGYNYPHPYSPSPVVFDKNWEVNIQAWDMEGSLSREEFAVTTLLYDLIDKHKDKGDDIEMSIESLLEIIKDDSIQTVKALYDKLKTVEDAGKVDALFTAHGFFWDKQEGDGYWNYGTHTYTEPEEWKTCTTTASEPHQDTNNDSVLDTQNGDKWMDYSNWHQYPCIPTYDEGDVVGYTGSYQTNARESFVNLPNRFIDVNNGTYTQEFTFPDNPEYNYKLEYVVTNNMMPVVFPPARYNATAAISNTKGDESQNITLTTEEYSTLINETADEEVFKVIRTEKKKNLLEEGDTEGESEGGTLIWWLIFGALTIGWVWHMKKKQTQYKD